MDIQVGVSAFTLAKVEYVRGQELLRIFSQNSTFKSVITSAIMYDLHLIWRCFYWLETPISGSLTYFYLLNVCSICR